LKQADASRTIEYARSDGLARLRSQEATSYSALQGALGLNGTELLQFRWAEIAGKLQDVTLSRYSYPIIFALSLALTCMIDHDVNRH
jgi:hypothetical protein